MWFGAGQLQFGAVGTSLLTMVRAGLVWLSLSFFIINGVCVVVSVKYGLRLLSWCSFCPAKATHEGRVYSASQFKGAVHHG